jgi:hypothetical protein
MRSPAYLTLHLGVARRALPLLYTQLLLPSLGRSWSHTQQDRTSSTHAYRLEDPVIWGTLPSRTYLIMNSHLRPKALDPRRIRNHVH